MAQQKEEIEDVGALVQSHVANNVERLLLHLMLKINNKSKIS